VVEAADSKLCVQELAVEDIMQHDAAMARGVVCLDLDLEAVGKSCLSVLRERSQSSTP
jgi:hypothetical protein